jgi:transposase-like protein
LHRRTKLEKTGGMPGLTLCPFCQSTQIRARLPVRDLHQYECEACARTWLVASPRRQAKIVPFPSPAARAKRRAGGSRGGS